VEHSDPPQPKANILVEHVFILVRSGLAGERRCQTETPSLSALIQKRQWRPFACQMDLLCSRGFRDFRVHADLSPDDPGFYAVAACRRRYLDLS
jgi:hypothetical protein